MNAWTKVAARWFPIQERATAVGLAAVGNFLGTGIGLVLTPLLILRFPIPRSRCFTVSWRRSPPRFSLGWRVKHRRRLLARPSWKSVP